MSVKLVDPLTLPEWDRWVGAFPESFFFHGTGWLGVLQETYGHRAICPCETRSDGIEAALPLMEVASRLTGRRGVSLPFTDFCRTLGGTSEQRGALFEAAMAEGRRRKWRYLECRDVDEGWKGASASVFFWGHRIDLRAGAKRLLAGLDSSVRRNVRKAEKAGLTVRYESDDAAMASFFRLHCRTRKRHGLPPQPALFFRKIRERLVSRGGGTIGFALSGEKPIAAAVYLNFGRRAFYKFGASDQREQEWRANDLLMWKSIERFAGEGFEELHLGRTSLKHEGLRRFKLGFGAAEERISFCRFDFGKEGFVTDEDRVDGWHNRVFGALPLPALRLAGRILYPHLS